MDQSARAHTSARVPNSKKNSVLSYVFLALPAGFFLLLLIVWMRIVIPLIHALPPNFHYGADIVSQDNFYDEANGQYQGETFSVTKFFYDVVAIKNGIYTIKNVFDVHRSTGEKIFSVERLYGIDPATRTHVGGNGDRDRSGYLFAPQNLDKGDFTYWHVNYDAPAQMHFAAVEKIEGLTVYRYEANFHADQTTDLKYLPEVGTSRGVNLDINLKLWIEPVTGHLVNYRDDTIAYYYDVITGDRIAPWNHFTNTFADESIREHAHTASSNKQTTIMVDRVIPIFLLFLALVSLVMASVYHQNRATAGLKKIAIIAIPVIFLVFTVFVAWFVYQNNRERVQTEFENQSRLIEDDILDRIDVYKNILEGARGLIAASQEVERSEWEAYADSVKVVQNYPGVLGLGYAKYLTPDELATHTAAIRTEGFPEYSVHPEGVRSEYTSIIYLEPFDGRNQRAFGYDMLTEPTRAKALQEARDNGIPTLSGKVTLVQETEADKQNGFLLYIPVYKKGQPTDTVSQRRQNLAGFVYSPFRMNDFIDGILGSTSSPIQFQIFDDIGTTNAKLLYSHTGENLTVPAFTRTKTIYVVGHPWTIYYSASAAFGSELAQLVRPIAILAVGSMISILLFLLFYTLVSSQSRAQSYAHILTHDLQNSNSALAQAQQMAHIGSWEWEVGGKKFHWSDEMYRIFGLEPDSVIPSYERYLKYIHPDDRKEVEEILEQAQQSQQPFSLYHRIVRPSGDTRVLYSQGKVITQDTILKIFGTAQDVTEQRMAEDTLKERTAELENINKTMIGRELKMVELKKELSHLKKEEKVG